MAKQIRKFVRNIKSKQYILGTIVVTLIMIISILSFGNISLIETARADFETQDSTSYGYYKQITISNTYVETDLAEFPILVHDDTGDLLGKVLNNASDIAFYALGNATQYNHEIEFYNVSTGELWAWVNITSLSSSAETYLFMYYGDSDGGYTIGHNPTYVWDENYVFVLHMTSNGLVVNESTTNNYDGRKNSSGHPPEVDGIVGPCLDFEYTGNNDNVSINQALSPYTEITIECWTYFESDGLIGGMVGDAYQTTTATDSCWRLQRGADNAIYFQVLENAGFIASIGTGAVAAADGWKKYVGIWNGTDAWVYINKTVKATAGSASGTMSNPAGDNVEIGCEQNGLPNVYRHLDGQIDEIRFSDIARNTSWLNASYDSSAQTSGFITLGTEHEQQGEGASSFDIKGLQEDIITWSGTVGTTVWCNSSGDYEDTMEINFSVNSTDNVTEFRVWVGNLNDTNMWVNASNISVVFSSDNTTWNGSGGLGDINTTAFTDGGSNVSVNSTQWADSNGMYGPNPFTYGGITNKNISVWCRFKLSIPSTITTDDFWSATTTSWKVYIGYYE